MNRDSIDVRYKWDLSKIYGSIDEYKKDINKVNGLIKEFKRYENINLDSQKLYDLLSLLMDTNRIIDKLEAYVSLLGDEDTRINKNQELKEEVDNICDNFIKATYFIDNAILKIDYGVIEEYYKETPKLKEYEIYLKRMFRFKNHILSDTEEKLLANITKAVGHNYDTYELLKDSDLTFPSFNVDGVEYELDGSKYSLYIENSNREVRRLAFDNLYSVYKQYKNTFASLISSNIKEEEAFAKIRHYDNAIEASLFHDELDISIHDNLVKVIHDRMDVVHDYYKLKKDGLMYIQIKVKEQEDIVEEAMIQIHIFF